jgi:hypothetical protein
MLFGKLKKALRKLFGLEKAEVKYYAEVKGWPDKWEHHAPKEEVIEPSLPPSCHVIRYPERIRKPGSQAIHKVSPKNFKPRTAHERKLWASQRSNEED